MTSLDAPPIRCFLSYAREDDLVMDFVEPFTKSLRQYAYADRGRELDIFVDREAIGWGDLAQPVVRAAVRSATVFLPLLTRRYFDRPYCREELFIFYNQAHVDDVGSLLLPVVLLGDAHLTSDSADQAVQIVVERQYRGLREAWLEGPSSPTWRRTLLGLAGELVDRVEEAEQRLVSLPPTPVDVDVEAELARLVDDVHGAFATMTAELEAALEIPPADRPKLLSPFADRVRTAGRFVERRVLEVDRQVRATSYLPDDLHLLDLGVLPAMEALVARTRQAEVDNAGMRRPIAMFREGFTAMRTGFRVMESWAELPNPGQ